VIEAAVEEGSRSSAKIKKHDFDAPATQFPVQPEAFFLHSVIRDACADTILEDSVSFNYSYPPSHSVQIKILGNP
jgi:hypothetical protein